MRRMFVLMWEGSRVNTLQLECGCTVAFERDGTPTPVCTCLMHHQLFHDLDRRNAPERELSIATWVLVTVGVAVMLHIAWMFLR